MPHGLLVSGLEIIDSATDSFQSTADVALTGRAVDDPGMELAR